MSQETDGQEVMYTEDPEEVMEKWKYLAKEDVLRSGILGRSVKKQYQYCFKAKKNLSQAIDIERWELAYFHFQRLIKTAMAYDLFEHNRFTRKHRRTSLKMKRYIEQAMEDSKTVKEKIIEKYKETSVEKGKVYVKVTPTLRDGPSGSKADKQKPLPMSKFAPHIIAGDGHCAFRAICQGLSGGNVDERVESQGVSNLRQQVCSLLQRFQKEMTSTGLTVSDLATTERGIEFEQYCKEMKDNAYAGEIEFILLSRGLGIKISVYQLDKETRKYKLMQQYGSVGRKVCLLFQPGKTEAGNHYDLLLPKRE